MAGGDLAAGVPLADSAAGGWLRDGHRHPPSGGFTAHERNAALRAWTGRWDYQRAIVAGRVRIKLDGTDGGAITEPEREHALERLKALSERGPTKRAAATNSGPTTSRTTTIQDRPENDVPPAA